MVMLRAGATFDPKQALQHLGGSLAERPSVVDITTEGGATVAAIPGGFIAMMHMAMPIPTTDSSGPVTVLSRESSVRNAIAGHDTHLIVHASSNELDLLDLRLFHTQLVASVVAVADAVGVYVGDAMMIQPAHDYLAGAADASRDNLPIALWIGFNEPRVDSGHSAYTTGLASFGLRELEIRLSQKSVEELFRILAGVASYQLTTGRALSDGDSFGSTVFERTRVCYAESSFMPGTSVALLDVE